VEAAAAEETAKRVRRRSAEAPNGARQDRIASFGNQIGQSGLWLCVGAPAGSVPLAFCYALPSSFC
jgi:hypothetical protein